MRARAGAPHNRASNILQRTEGWTSEGSASIKGALLRTGLYGRTLGRLHFSLHTTEGPHAASCLVPCHTRCCRPHQKCGTALLLAADLSFQLE